MHRAIQWLHNIDSYHGNKDDGCHGIIRHLIHRQINADAYKLSTKWQYNNAVTTYFGREISFRSSKAWIKWSENKTNIKPQYADSL